MIQRIKDYNKRMPSRDAHKIYVVCEGKETVPKYFDFFMGLSSNLQVISIPPEDGQTDPKKLMERAKELFLSEDRTYSLDFMDGDTVWFVIDTDTWEMEGKIAPLRQFCEKENTRFAQQLDEVKAYKAWNVAQSNPSFEIWLYYHFYEETPETDDIRLHSSFKEYVSLSISGGFNYEIDVARLGEAITNAAANLKYDKNNKVCLYSTEMVNLGREIDKFVHASIRKLRNKLG